MRWMLRLKVAFGPLWDPRKNRRGSQAVCRCLCHLYSAVAQCYEAMRQEVVTILPLFAFWAEEDLIIEDWFEWHVISESEDGNRSSLTNRELATIASPIERAADDIDRHIGNLRDMVWREFPDWPRRVRSPAAPDPSPRVQKGLPALPQSPTPEAATNGPIPEAPTDRIELAAPPSVNGTAATNGRAFEAPAEMPGNPTSETHHSGSPVELNGPDEEVIVWGKRMGVLTPTQYRVIEALAWMPMQKKKPNK